MKTNEQLCNYALEFVGKVKYRFGSNDIPHGVGDCSSFTSYVFNHFGLTIGRDTQTQYTNTIPVQDKNAVAGDLIFFKNTYSNNHTDGVSHVGVYLGDNKFVHNSSSHGVAVSEISGYYSDHFLSFRRVNGLSKTTEKVDAETNGTTADSNANDSTTSSTKAIGLTWWGDIVKVIVIVIILIMALVYFSASMGLNIQAGIFKVKGGK